MMVRVFKSQFDLRSLEFEGNRTGLGDVPAGEARRGWWRRSCLKVQREPRH
jgi:hypothetical protein